MTGTEIECFPKQQQNKPKEWKQVRLLIGV